MYPRQVRQVQALTASSFVTIITQPSCNKAALGMSTRAGLTPPVCIAGHSQIQVTDSQIPAKVSTFLAYSENRVIQISTFRQLCLKMSGFMLSHSYFHACSHLAQLLFHFQLE